MCLVACDQLPNPLTNYPGELRYPHLCHEFRADARTGQARSCSSGLGVLRTTQPVFRWVSQGVLESEEASGAWPLLTGFA